MKSLICHCWLYREFELPSFAGEEKIYGKFDWPSFAVIVQSVRRINGQTL